MGSHPLLMVHVKVYYSQFKYTPLNKNGFTPFANGRYQSLLQSTRVGSHPLLMVDIKVYYCQQEWVDVRVYCSQREYIATFVELICIHKFN